MPICINNCSISILVFFNDPYIFSICAKIFGRILFNNIYNYLICNNLITNKQSGFRPGDSINNQWLYLVDLTQTFFDHKLFPEVRSDFLDISKAFDKYGTKAYYSNLNKMVFLDLY